VGFWIIQTNGQDTVDDLSRDGLLTDLERFLKGARQVVAQLEGRHQPLGQYVQGLVGDDGFGLHLARSTLGQQPNEVLTRLTLDAFQGEDLSTRANLL